MTLGIDHALWGMDPRGYHLTNVILHAANTVLFYCLAIMLLRLARARVTSVRGSAALAALLFGIHPLRVESVAWVTERRDVLSALFLLLTLLAWLRVQTSTANGQKRGRAWWYGASLTCFALSLLSKAWGMLRRALRSAGGARRCRSGCSPRAASTPEDPAWYCADDAHKRLLAQNSRSLRLVSFLTLLAGLSAQTRAAALAPHELSLRGPPPRVMRAPAAR